MPAPRIAAAARSERGARTSNQDATCVLQDGGHWLAVLADGAGGHRDGAEASRRAVAQLEAMLHGASPPFEAGTLTRAVLAAHASVRENPPESDIDQMHSTVVVLWIDAERGALWSNVGDSRLYRVRSGRVDLLTTDDSVTQNLVDAGLLTPEQARAHPGRSQLVAALGIADELEPHTLALPEAIVEGDAFLLCSDGWWSVVDDGCIADTLSQACSPDEWLDVMRRHIESRAVPRQDNFSAIGVWIGEAGDLGEVTRPRMQALQPTG